MPQPRIMGGQRVRDKVKYLQNEDPNHGNPLKLYICDNKLCRSASLGNCHLQQVIWASFIRFTQTQTYFTIFFVPRLAVGKGQDPNQTDKSRPENIYP